MPATVIVGLQWGDEGKGKTTDFLAEQVAMAVRYQGGDNAGHTVVLGDEVFKLRLTPSGVLYPHITSVIGPGVVVNPDTLITELDMLAARGIDTAKVRVSRNAHVIMPYHVALDRAMEARLDGEKVGTTNRGIGPTYADRASRLGLRMEDLLDEATFRHRLARVLPDKNTLLATMAGTERFEAEPLVERAMAWGERLRPHLADTTWLVQDALARGDHVLLEGAQGTLLDIDHGSYPYVTSSNPIAGGACTGGGIGPLQVDEVIGVMKAYTTRVGRGTLPDRAPRRDRGRDRRARPRVRDRDRPAAPGRLVRRGPAPLCRGREQREQHHAQQDRHPVRHRRDPHVRRLRDRRQAGRELAVERRSPRPGDPGLRALPRLVRAAQRRPDAGRAARERPPLRGRARGRGRGPDRARLGRPGADPDDRAGLPPDAPPPDGAGRTGRTAAPRGATAGARAGTAEASRGANAR